MDLKSMMFTLALGVLVCTLDPCDAHWNCHGCIDSLTVNLQVTDARFAGTDTETRTPHTLELGFFCHPLLLHSDDLYEAKSFIEEHAAVLGNISFPTLPPVFNGSYVSTFAHQTVRMSVPLDGLILKEHSRVYTADITRQVKQVCGPCVAPIHMRDASLHAGHSDGIEVKSFSVIANYENESAGLLTLDRIFRNGWLDKSPFPKPYARRYIPLHKAGC